MLYNLSQKFFALWDHVSWSKLFFGTTTYFFVYFLGGEALFIITYRNEVSAKSVR